MGTDAPLIDISEDKLVQFETAVMTVPQFDTDNPRMISQGPSVCVFNKEEPQEVMASWLFTQYLMSNEVQIAYSETEGYVPVTTKARESQEYQDYLSAEGQDNNEHYEVKIKAAKLLLNNVDNTFVTPVFVGSASLRDAAGQLIENTVKSVRRGQTVDDEYIDSLYSDISSLYRLDQIALQNSRASSGKSDLGQLPKISVILLVSLAVAWVFIIAYFLRQTLKRKRIQQ